MKKKFFIELYSFLCFALILGVWNYSSLPYSSLFDKCSYFFMSMTDIHIMHSFIKTFWVGIIASALASILLMKLRHRFSLHGIYYCVLSLVQSFVICFGLSALMSYIGSLSMPSYLAQYYEQRIAIFELVLPSVNIAFVITVLLRLVSIMKKSSD